MTSFNRTQYSESVLNNLIKELDRRGLRISDEASSGFFDILKESLKEALDSTFLQLTKELSPNGEVLETIDK